MNVTQETAAVEEIAATIKGQIGIWPFAEVGARDFKYGRFTLQGETPQLPGLAFTAKPTTRLVEVYVLLDSSDTYTIVVRKRNTHEIVTLARWEGIYAGQLPSVIRLLPEQLSVKK